MHQICLQCSASFEITQEDLAFYDAVSPMIAGKKHALPPPDICPSCRYQQRLTWRNERTMYRRTCAATGKQIVSIFSPDKSWPPVYEQSYWWSDQWDAKAYGKEFDFSQSFFDQWAALFREVPQIALNNQQSENCEFTNQSQRNKDSYMVFCSNDCRDCLHCMWAQTAQSCVDCSYLGQGELCYQTLNTHNCYRCTFSQNLENCSEVHFSRNCIGCKSCIGCVNLRNKEFWFFNEQLTREEYERRIVDLRLDRWSSQQSVWSKTLTFFRGFPRKYYEGSNIENASGDYLMRVHVVHDAYNCRDGEYMHHCQDAWRTRSCQDLTETAETEFCYSLEGIGVANQSIFSKKLMDLSNSMYCSHCNFSKNLFGCISLNHAQYCILNKQYAKEEYEELVPRIIEHMRHYDEWGRHFPTEYSPYAYNETVAQEYFPMTREEVEVKGWKWRDPSDDLPKVDRIIPASQLPDSIEEIPNDILNWAIECEITKRPFKIIKQELEFYRQMKLPIPRLHPDERYRQRMALRNPRKLWDQECAKCHKPIVTSYAPERPEIVWCEECYLQEVY